MYLNFARYLIKGYLTFTRILQIKFTNIKHPSLAVEIELLRFQKLKYQEFQMLRNRSMFILKFIIEEYKLLNVWMEINW